MAQGNALKLSGSAARKSGILSAKALCPGVLCGAYGRATASYENNQKIYNQGDPADFVFSFRKVA